MLPRYWFALHPDLNTPIGGVKQSHRLCEHLAASGRESCLIQDESGFHPSWFKSSVKSISRHEFLRLDSLDPSMDILILPETYINVFETYAPGFCKIVFNQNGAYTFGNHLKKSCPTPSAVYELYRHPELLSVLCVSQHDEKFLTQGLCLDSSRVSRLVNPLETEIFCLGQKKIRQVAYMPRKNYQDTRIVTELLSRQPWWEGWKLVPIHNMSQSEVSSVLKKSIAFLSFGHPEGFGLPAAEALACGCYLIGYSGIGGRELFDLGYKYRSASEIQFGDWQGFIDAVQIVDTLLLNTPQELLNNLSSVSSEVRSRYGLLPFRQSVELAMHRWEELFLSRA